MKNKNVCKAAYNLAVYKGQLTINSFYLWYLSDFSRYSTRFAYELHYIVDYQVIN